MTGVAPPTEVASPVLNALIAAHRARKLHGERQAFAGRLVDEFLTHAVVSVPAYRELDSPVLSAFPVVDRAALSRGGRAYWSSVFEPDSLVVRTTSGTTGVPLSVPRDPASDYQFVYGTYRLVFDRIAELTEPQSDRCAVIQVNDNPTRREHSLLNPELRYAPMHHVVIGRAEAADRDTVRRIADEGPQLIGGRPRGLLALADLGARSGVALRPQAVLSTGDNLHSDDRARLESAFQAPVYNGYASQEGGLLALECPHRIGMVTYTHVRAEVALPGADGRDECRPTGSGPIVISSAANWAMPIVRYQTGDHGELVANTSCGCGPQVLANLHGRESPYFEFGGRRVNPSLLNPCFEALPVEQFRVTQTEAGDLDIEWVPRGSPDPAAVGKAIARAVDELGGPVPSVRQVARIGAEGEKVQRYRKVAGHQA